MIKILAACGAGVNSSHQIKSALEEELSNRGYDVHCDAVMVKDVNEDLMKGYDIFTPIAATDLGFEPGIPVIEAGSIGSRTKWYGFNTDFRFEQMLGQELIESVKHRYG
ncbi:PTS system galactose-specific transporter subunit IIB [Streptococcus pneumoniae]|uniref:PTS fructose transporter subunit IIB n=1 Tax=Streptococcus pneumoniae TaxID=1313 RepID=UPI00076570DD|nr:PTS system galactose-specific transporter subunit IIB [Streptococcus pneumoniae]